VPPSCTISSSSFFSFLPARTASVQNALGGREVRSIVCLCVAGAMQTIFDQGCQARPMSFSARRVAVCIGDRRNASHFSATDVIPTRPRPKLTATWCQARSATPECGGMFAVNSENVAQDQGR
jgi:hypothetical protein